MDMSGTEKMDTEQKERTATEQENFTLDMPEYVKEIIGTIEDHGFQAFAVGGCVRYLAWQNSG